MVALLNSIRVIDDYEEQINFPEPDVCITIEIRDQRHIGRLALFLDPKGWDFLVQMGDFYIITPRGPICEGKDELVIELLLHAAEYDIGDMWW